ncbi:RagB/SusD family nutrient uptake outer membrane protein [Chryseobacterium indoltheticum]|uniref:RagB/SusD family nutrient uptake outer membrane protein n=1 Tax=Chryseobacterium indoltheticum TaxID=254 RepID=UPI0019149EBA|nr:RagB/SusD family nutrient uptake outer membrane protein [Chryseobacterium indoltheticum]QQQ26780.1 RagB/SusD family nutrient uptake outer membrane protein [Chryseobacterium indoltheticum]
MKKIIKIGFLSLSIAAATIACSEDFVEREFYQDVEQAPLKTVNEVQAFVRGIYSSMRATAYYGADFLAYAEVRSDEMYSTLQAGYYQNVYNYTMLSNDPYAVNTYNQIYTAVAKANIVINTDMSTLEGGAANQNAGFYAQGQAYGLRAITFFDAFRLYGQKYIPTGTLGIVLPLKYDPKALMPRATIAETEAQIEADFTKALALMTANSSGQSASKTELNINSLKGMMSRFYLYKGDYVKVRSLTADIYKKYTVASPDLFQTTFSFIMNGAAPNSIFELAVGINSSLSTGSYRQRLNPQGYANVVVSKAAYDSYTDTDIRKKLITISGGVRYLSNNNGTGKYTNIVGADNIKMLRYEEILLNGVEAELNGGDPLKALEYYNLIITNRGLPAATSVTIPLLKQERMKELLGEGLRQWDLRRWGDTVPRPSSASTDANLNAFPIPRGETDLANSPIKSNPGYDN